MSRLLRIVSPVDGSVLAQRPSATAAEIEQALGQARSAQREWQAQDVASRAAACRRLVAHMVGQCEMLAEEITRQMGRPIRHSPLEIRGGFAERASYMIDIAGEALADRTVAPGDGITRFVRRVPLGLVFVLAPWNYPYLTSVNSVIPALMAGNAVLLKHAEQTLLCAERYAAAAIAAGLPEGLLQAIHLTHADVAMIIQDVRVDYVAFTGSVAGGHAVERAAASRFVGVGLELGGKDPAYVREDADLAHAVENLVDGAFFNAGQSCCGVERVYVHQSQYPDFVTQAVALTAAYRLDNPLLPETTLGPMVRSAAADGVRAQIAAAIADGARALIDPADFAADAPGTPYLAPQILVGVDHRMEVMREESFGPLLAIMSVPDDETAVALMNDSRYGLTASIWTRDVAAAISLGSQVECGTCYMNRCDYLDPSLPWSGIKDSGRGTTLSALGYEQLTRPRAFHLRVTVP